MHGSRTKYEGQQKEHYVLSNVNRLYDKGKIYFYWHSSFILTFSNKSKTENISYQHGEQFHLYIIKAVLQSE